MNRQLREHHAQKLFEKTAGQLRIDLQLGVARRHLDVSVTLLDYVLPDCGATLLTEAYRKELAELRQQVQARAILRRVK
jgi:hypothetical protein